MVAGRRGVLGCLHRQSSRRQPARGAPVNLARGVRIERGELEPGELSEYRVHAEPAAVLESRHEQIRLLELGQDGAGIGPIEHAVTELSGETAQHRGAQEECSGVVIERGDHLAAEVVGDEAVIAAELAGRCVRIVDPTQPITGEKQRRRPTLGAFAEKLDVAGSQLYASPLDKQFRGLLRGKRELVGA